MLSLRLENLCEIVRYLFIYIYNFCERDSWRCYQNPIVATSYPRKQSINNERPPRRIYSRLGSSVLLMPRGGTTMHDLLYLFSSFTLHALLSHETLALCVVYLYVDKCVSRLRR